MVSLKSTIFLFTLSLNAAVAKTAPSGPTTSSSGNAKPLQFSSPLQTYTLFDKTAISSPQNRSPRSKFLPRFRVGLMAERRAREAIMDEQRRGLISSDEDYDMGGDQWAEHSAQAEERKNKAMERRVEQAYDEAVSNYDERVAGRIAARGAGVDSAGSSTGTYQFVGLVNDGKSKEKSVTWYARKKPKSSNWSVRLVHVNRDAVLRDLFVKGKVDVFGRYVNEGLDRSALVASGGGKGEGEEGEQQQSGMKPLVKGQYSVRENSWRTLWNFHPKRVFHTSSGSFWRERRISPGLYTDGNDVFETVYRYRDGKNGMKPVGKLSNFLASPSLGAEEKIRVVERLKGKDAPDVVVEK